MIVADLFLEQSSSWEVITRSHIEKVWKASKIFLSHVTAHIADVATSRALFEKIFEPALNQLLGALNAKVTEMLTPHQKSHPITYNHDFNEALQKVRNERSADEYTRILKSFFSAASLDSVYLNNQYKDLRPLVTVLVKGTELDMKRFACSEVLDCMDAYYKVSFPSLPVISFSKPLANRIWCLNRSL